MAIIIESEKHKPLGRVEGSDACVTAPNIRVFENGDGLVLFSKKRRNSSSEKIITQYQCCYRTEIGINELPLNVTSAGKKFFLSLDKESPDGAA